MKIRKILKLLTSLGLALLMSFGAVACTPPPDELPLEVEDNGEPYELVYYLVYNDANPPQDLASVQVKLNTLLKKKINSTIKIHAYTLAEYTSKVSGAIGAEVKFDVCATSPSMNPYITNVQREAFYPLDYLLPTYAPETWAAIPEQMWEQARVNGHIYASINEQIFPRTFTYNAKSEVNIQAFLDEKYNGILPSEVNTLKMDAFEFLEEYMQWLKVNRRGAGGKIAGVSIESVLLAWYGYDDLGTGMSVPGAVQIDDETATVVNQFDTDAFRELINTVYDWKEKGYIDSSISGYDLTADSTWKPGYNVGQSLRLGDAHYFTSYVIGTMNAISSTSQNPARAMKFIELLRTDPEIHNLLQFGIEDVHYIKDPANPNRIASFVEGSGYNNQNFGWGLGTEFISYLLPDQEDNQWEQVKQINAETPLSDLIGFNFDATALKQKIADCKAVTNEYIQAFQNAQYKASDVDAKYEEFLTRLDAAGAREIVNEKQRQLNEFLASKNQ